VRHLLFGFDDSEREIVPPVFAYVLNLVKFFIWLSRNNFRFRSMQPSIRDVLTSVRQRLFFFLLFPAVVEFYWEVLAQFLIFFQKYILI
jgi:hypothetical protein